MSGAELIPFPASRPLPSCESQAWDEYLAAVAELQAEHPNVHVSTCRRVVETYERFCFLMTRGHAHG